MLALAVSPEVAGVAAVVGAALLGLVTGIAGGSATVRSLERRILLLRQTVHTVAARTTDDNVRDLALDALARDEILRAGRTEEAPDAME